MCMTRQGWAAQGSKVLVSSALAGVCIHLYPPLRSHQGPRQTFVVRGWGRILLGSTPPTQHQELGWGLTDLTVSVPFNGGKCVTGCKDPSLAQLRKLESPP